MGAQLTPDSIDAYGVLGVAPTASYGELKAAHRALVRRFHPDLAPAEERENATQRVQQINVAYGLVRDPQRRAEYDRLRSSPGAALDRLVTAAGVWAGRWWARNRALVRGDVPLARRAGRVLGRLVRGI